MWLVIKTATLCRQDYTVSQPTGAEYEFPPFPCGHYIGVWIIPSVKWPTTDLMTWFRFPEGAGIFLFPSASGPALGPSLLSGEYRGALSPVVKDPGRQSDPTHLYSVKLRICGVSLPVTYSFSLRGVGQRNKSTILCSYCMHRNSVRDECVSLHIYWLIIEKWKRLQDTFYSTLFSKLYVLDRRS
jgi:hypothetical protein